MNVLRSLTLVILFGLLSPCRAWGTESWVTPNVDHLNRHLHGQIVDYTDHHGRDNRIWSQALCRPRNLYVYLPPGYDASLCYPCMLYLHGVNQDERAFLPVAEAFDRVMRSGELPPMIIAAPDGSIQESNSFFHQGSFFLNSDAGRFEDFVMQDVWCFVRQHYLIRPEREAHVIGGASMGGFAAYNLGFKYRQEFGILIGILPPLNLRWVDCHGRYRTKFDPDCWGYREEARPRELLGRFFLVYAVRMSTLIDPLFERGTDVIGAMSRNNPIEMIDTHAIQPGEFQMFVGYGGLDQLNISAQVESFLWVANCQHQLGVKVAYLPLGRHSTHTAMRIFPEVVNWLAPLIAPYSPCRPETCGAAPSD